MRLSRKCDYALRALIRMVERGTDEYQGIADIAREEEIPLRFLEQVCLALKNAGILSSKSGPSGGYRLRRDPADVSLVEVVRIIDGPVAPARCVSHTAYESCPREGKCKLQPVLAEVRDAIAQILEGMTLASVAERSVVRRKKRSGRK